MTNLLGNKGMVAGKLMNFSNANKIDPAVSHMSDGKFVFSKTDTIHRGSHPLILGIGFS